MNIKNLHQLIRAASKNRKHKFIYEFYSHAHLANNKYRIYDVTGGHIKYRTTATTHASLRKNIEPSRLFERENICTIICSSISLSFAHQSQRDVVANSRCPIVVVDNKNNRNTTTTATTTTTNNNIIDFDNNNKPGLEL